MQRGLRSRGDEGESATQRMPAETTFREGGGETPLLHLPREEEEGGRLLRVSEGADSVALKGGEAASHRYYCLD